MKLKLLFFLGLLLSCACKAEKSIDVIYLTANAYCPSVEEIEREAKTVIDSLYKIEKEKGIIIERKLNIMEEANQDFIHKWEISTNGLVLLVNNNGVIEKVDLNDFAFSNVPSDIPFFKKGFAEKLKEILTSK